MADFDPSKYLENEETTGGFNPEAYLAEEEEMEFRPEYVDSTSNLETAFDFTQGVAQGGTFNFADEIRAGLQAGVLNPLDALITGEGAFGDQGFIESLQNLPENYERALQTEREGFEESQQRSPTAFATGEIGAAVAPYLIPGAAAGRALGAVGKAATAPTRAISGLGKAAEVGQKGSLLANITGGAAMGAADIGLREVGASEADTAEELALDAIQGVGTGAAFGGLTPVALKGAQSVLKGIGKTLGYTGKALEDFIFSNSPVSRGFRLGRERLAAFSGSTEEAAKRQLDDYVDNVSKQIEQNVDDIVGKNTAKINEVYTQQLDDAINKKGDIPIEFGNFLNKIKTDAGEKIGELRRNASKQGLKVNVKEVTDEFKKAVDDAVENLPDDQKDVLEKTLRAIRQSVQEVGESKEIKGRIQTALNDEGDEIKRTIDAASKDADLEFLPPEMVESLLRQGEKTGSKVKIKPTKDGGYTLSKIVDDFKFEELGPINYKKLTPEELANMISGKKTAVLQAAIKRNQDPIIQPLLMDYRRALGNLENQLIEDIGSQKEVFSAIKTLLEDIGEVNVSTYTDDILPTPKVNKLINDISRVLDKGNMREIRARLAPIEKIKPGFTDDFIGNIQEVTRLEKTLRAAGDDALAQADALLTVGQDDVTAKALRDAQTEIRRGETIRREAGELSDDITATSEQLPGDKTRRFLRNLTSEATKNEEARRAKNAADLIELYNPELAKSLKGEGKLMGELSKFIDTINAQGDSSLSAVSNVLGAIGSRFGRGANALGYTTTKLNDVLTNNEAVRELFRTQLIPAAERGPQALASTIYILNQRNEDFREFYNDMQEDLGRFENEDVKE
jgi:hypothetical protein